MITMNGIVREAKFMLRDRAVLVWMVVVFSLSTLTIWFGLSEIDYQQTSIEKLREADQQDRLAEIYQQKSWGAAAYYNFHLTYDPPSNFAFAAIGKRDLLPWKHRIRMLAIEGQIYERDVGNPVFALIGRLDFAFLATFILPLVLIILLYDTKAAERIAGRHELLVATAGHPFSFWLIRICLRACVIFGSLMLPLIFAGIVNGTELITLVWVSIYVFFYTAFWALVCYWFAARRQSSAIILVSLISTWLMLAVIIPAGARYAIDQIVSIPSGADILLMQRETVNDAWDLPKQETMTAFVERHPELAEYSEINNTFEWKWYYAFQQVGDQKAEQLSSAYTIGRIQRDRLAGIVAVLVPPVLLERSLQKLAKTDVITALAYQEKVRTFHAELRSFYYPKLFRDEPFIKPVVKDLPVFDAVR